MIQAYSKLLVQYVRSEKQLDGVILSSNITVIPFLSVTLNNFKSLIAAQMMKRVIYQCVRSAATILTELTSVLITIICTNKQHYLSIYRKHKLEKK